MSAMYAVYHGPDGLRHIGRRIHHGTVLLAKGNFTICDIYSSIYTSKTLPAVMAVYILFVGISEAGHTVNNEIFYDTLKITPKNGADEIRQKAQQKMINLRYFSDGDVSTEYCSVKPI